jgi:hypothetical protein
MWTGRQHDRQYPVTYLPIGPKANLIDLTGRIHARDVGWLTVGQAGAVHTGTQPDVGRVHRGGVHPDANFSGTCVGLRQVNDSQRLRPTEYGDGNRLHGHI